MGVAAIAALVFQAASIESTPSADALFVQACVAAEGDRLALAGLARTHGWVAIPTPATVNLTSTEWAESYAAGDTTITLAGFSASTRDPARAVNIIYPAGTFCRVIGAPSSDWRETVGQVAERRLAMRRLGPVIRRESGADLQSAAWQGHGRQIVEAQHRRSTNTLEVAWIRSEPAVGAQ